MDQLAVFVDGEELRSPQALFPVSSWHPRAVLVTGPAEHAPAEGGLLHVAFFGRGLADEELRNDSMAGTSHPFARMSCCRS